MEKQPTGRGPKGCDENGPAAALLLGRVSIQICSAAPKDVKSFKGYAKTKSSLPGAENRKNLLRGNMAWRLWDSGTYTAACDRNGHRRKSFSEEYVELLKRFNVPHDQR